MASKMDGLVPVLTTKPLVTDKLLQSEPCMLKGLTCRSSNCLFNMTKQHPWSLVVEHSHLPSPTTVAELLKYTPAMLLSFRGFGRGSLINLVAVLAMHGLRLMPQDWEDTDAGE